MYGSQEETKKDDLQYEHKIRGNISTLNPSCINSYSNWRTICRQNKFIIKV